MKKFFFTVIVLVCLVGALFAGATFWFGMRAEQQYRYTLQQASQSPYIRLSNETYNRGFFQSKARTTVRIPDFSRGPGAGLGKEGDDLARFTLVHVIRHGPLPLWTSPEGKRELKPVLAIIETWIELSPETRGELKEVFDELPEIASMKNYTTLSLTGDGETQLVMPPLQKKVGKDKKVAFIWEGLTGNVAFSADFKKFRGAVSGPGFEAVGDDGDLKLTNLESTFEMHEDIHGLFLGDATFGLSQVGVVEKKEQGETRFSMRGFKMESSSKAVTDTVNYAMSMQVDQVMADGTPYGPGGYDLEVRKLDAAALARLQKIYQELQPEFSQRSPSEINQMVLAKYAEILPELLKKSPEIEFTRVSFTTSDGDFLGKAKITVDGTNAAALVNPLFLLGAVRAHVELSVTDRLLQTIIQSTYKKDITEAVKQGERAALSEAEIESLAATKSQKRLEMLLEKNILLCEDGSYNASADYQAGVVTLNGRPVTLQDLQGWD
jgi:uncharacterized protein YdgA (DUF945 family)